jgi:phosphopantetheine--protein transferase-like protein
LRALARLVLSRPERETFGAMKAVLQRRVEWLLGRIVAKDAVRDLLRRGSQALIPPADVVVAAEESGRPMVTEPWPGAWGKAPHVSIAHKAGVAVAAAASSEVFSGVGIDIESITSRDKNFHETAFTKHERELIDAEPENRRNVAATRIWCAKEALGKALGAGLADILAHVGVVDWEADGGVRVTASLPSRNSVAAVTVRTAIQHDFMIAIVAIPRAL